MRQDGRLFCNCCGRELKMEHGHAVEDFFHLEKTWGYFSNQDGISQNADICEFCMEQWMKEFKIQPETVERTEIFEC